MKAQQYTLENYCNDKKCNVKETIDSLLAEGKTWQATSTKHAKCSSCPAYKFMKYLRSNDCVIIKIGSANESK